MSFFKVTVTGGDSPIEMTKQITSVDVAFVTVNKDVVNKSSGMLAKATITGRIKPEDTNTCLALFKWAKDFKAKSQYRQVSIEVGEADDSIYRKYDLGKMFVVDYIEQYVSNKDENQTGQFELKLTQQDDNWDCVESFPS